MDLIDFPPRYENDSGARRSCKKTALFRKCNAELEVIAKIAQGRGAEICFITHSSITRCMLIVCVY